jgi:D-xylose transport system permease protein
VLGGIGVFVLESHRGIPLPLVLTLLLFGISDYVLTQTKFGVHIYAVGGNIEAAKRAGINISRLKLTLFVIAGGISAIAGIMAASRALAVSQASGGGIGGGALLLQGIAAPVIGGISLFGGRGQVSGAFLGALIIGTVSNGLNLMGIASELRLVVTGGLLISAVGIDKSIQRLTEP